MTCGGEEIQDYGCYSKSSSKGFSETIWVSWHRTVVVFQSSVFCCTAFCFSLAHICFTCSIWGLLYAVVSIWILDSEFVHSFLLESCLSSLSLESNIQTYPHSPTSSFSHQLWRTLAADPFSKPSCIQHAQGIVLGFAELRAVTGFHTKVKILRSGEKWAAGVTWLDYQSRSCSKREQCRD